MWKAEEWVSRGDNAAATAVSSIRAEALRACGQRQASVYRSLRTHCELLWQHLPDHVTRMRAAITDPTILEHFIAQEYEVDKNGTRKRIKRRKVFLENLGDDSGDESEQSADDDVLEMAW